jgi:hypothetical protein
MIFYLILHSFALHTFSFFFFLLLDYTEVKLYRQCNFYKAVTRQPSAVARQATCSLPKSKRLKTEKERCSIQDIIHKCTLTFCIKSDSFFFLLSFRIAHKINSTFTTFCNNQVISDHAFAWDIYTDLCANFFVFIFFFLFLEWGEPRSSVPLLRPN